MLLLRTFRNSDPPLLTEIWRQYFSCASRRVVPISVNILNNNILGLPFFDPKGLCIAFEDGVPVGFAHASFGPNRNRDDIDRETGVINLIMIVPSYPNREELCQMFIERSEKYLKRNGAKIIFGGSTRASASFYTGFYGGSEPLGIYGDDLLVSAYESAGYHIQNKTKRFQYDLRNYKTAFTPKSARWVRKGIKIEYSDRAPISHNWFQSCATAHFNWFVATAYQPPQKNPVAELFIRIFQPLDNLNLEVMVPPMASLFDYHVAPEFRREGLGTYVLGEALRYLCGMSGSAMIETVALDQELPYINFLTRFGWQEFDHGVIFIKILQERRLGKRPLHAATALASLVF